MTTWRRRTLWGSAGLLIAMAATVGWLGWTAKQAREQLMAARAELPAVRTAVLSGDGSAAGGLQRVRLHARAADDLTHDPVWTVVAGVPWLGTPAATTRGLTHAVRGIADTGMPALAQAADAVHPAHLLDGKGRVDVTALAAAGPALDRAAASLAEQRDGVAALAPSWASPVAQARSSLLAELSSLTGTSRDAAQAARVLPPMLGMNGPRRYFVAFQNPAEARGSGGLLDAFAVVVADRGAVRIERTGANTQLPPLSGEVTGVDPVFADRYAAVGATSDWLEANVSPNFPDVATAWEAMWQKATGQQLDGALALDPHTLSAALAATGPVTAPAVGTVDAHRIEPLVLHDQYVLPQLAAQRKSLMLGVGTAVIDALLAGRASPRVLLPGLQDAARAGHLVVHSRYDAEQQQLVRSGIAGAVDQRPGPFAQAVLVNAAGNKLDSWLSSSLDYTVLRCTPNARSVRLTVTLRNDAPAGGLPSYMTVRSDRPLYPTVTGQNRTELQLLVTQGAVVTSATLDGEPLPPAPAAEELPASLPDHAAAAFLQTGGVAGRPGYWLDLELRPAGGTRTVVLQLTEPVSAAAPRTPVQSMVLGTKVTTTSTACAGMPGAATGGSAAGAAA